MGSQAVRIRRRRRQESPSARSQAQSGIQAATTSAVLSGSSISPAAAPSDSGASSVPSATGPQPSASLDSPTPSVTPGPTATTSQDNSSSIASRDESSSTGSTPQPSTTSGGPTSTPSASSNDISSSNSVTENPPSSSTNPPSSSSSSEPPSSTRSSTDDSSSTLSSSASSSSTSGVSSTPPPSSSSDGPTSASTSSASSSSTTQHRSTDSSSLNGPSSSLLVASSDEGASLTTITSSFVTTINGHETTVFTVLPTTLNFPDRSQSNTKNRGGIIAGAAVGATVVALLLLGAVFLFHRRRRAQRRAYAHRALPMPRSSLLAEDDDFDLAGGGPRQPTLPPLLPVRGVETGSLFHEGVWPPPSERSRLEDPIIAAGSNVDLHSIVDDVMGTGHSTDHGRWSSADTAASSVPLLPPVAITAATSKGKTHRSSLGGSISETSPLNPGGHERQLSLDSHGSGSLGSPTRQDYSALPPGAAAPIIRGKSISTTGSPRPERRAPFGSLMVVNTSPEEEENAMPLVDLTPGIEEPPKEIPPLYHMIRRDTEGSLNSRPSLYSQTSNADMGTQMAAGNSAAAGGSGTHGEHKDGKDEETSPTVGQAL